MTTRFFRGSVIYDQHDPLNKGLVADYRFDRNTGSLLPDYSGYGRHGTLVEDVSWTTTRYGLALDFAGNGDDIVTLTDIPFGGTAPITIEAFVNADDVSGDYCIVGQGFEVVLRIQGTDWEFILNSFTANDRVAGGTPAAGPWFHLMGVYDGTNLILYENSINVASVVPTGTYSDDANAFQLGQLAGGDPTNWNGRMAVVRIYNRALTPGEVRARYQLTLRRMQTFGGERRFPVGLITAAPPVGPFLTTGGGYSIPVG